MAVDEGAEPVKDECRCLQVSQWQARQGSSREPRQGRAVADDDLLEEDAHDEEIGESHLEAAV